MILRRVSGRSGSLQILVPVRSSALCSRPLRMAGEPIPAKAVVPLFDEAGGVQQLLLVLEGPPGLAMIEPRQGLLCVPWVGPIRLSAASDALVPLSGRQIGMIERLWNVSPAWVVDTVATMSESAGAALSAGNCTDRWQGPVGSLLLQRDLTRVRGVTLVQKGGGVQFGRWNAKYLPVRASQLQSSPTSVRSGRTRWELRPIWQG